MDFKITVKMIDQKLQFYLCSPCQVYSYKEDKMRNGKDINIGIESLILPEIGTKMSQ